MFKLKIALAIFILLAITALVAWLLRLPEVNIRSSIVSGNGFTEVEDIKFVVEENLSGSYLWIVPKTSSFFYPKERIENEIDNAFPRINSVIVERTNMNTITIEVEEREPFALWCGREYSKDGENLGNCYFLDNLSYIYAKAPDFTGNVFFKYFGVIDIASSYEAKAPLGATYMTRENFFGIRPFLEAYEELGYSPVSLTKVDSKDYELRMSDGAVIIFGADTKLSILLDNMESILESDAFREAGDRKVEYIDLRFGNKVYYKFVDEEEKKGGHTIRAEE